MLSDRGARLLSMKSPNIEYEFEKGNKINQSI